MELDIEGIVRDAISQTKLIRIAKAMSEGKMAFRRLSKKELEDSIKWANENYTPFSDINGAWHPVVQQQCVKINLANTLWTDPDVE